MDHPRRVYGRRPGAHTDRRRRTGDVRRIASASCGAARPSRALCDSPRVRAISTSAVRTSLTLWRHPGRYAVIPSAVEPSPVLCDHASMGRRRAGPCTAPGALVSKTLERVHERQSDVHAEQATLEAILRPAYSHHDTGKC